MSRIEFIQANKRPNWQTLFPSIRSSWLPFRIAVLEPHDVAVDQTPIAVESFSGYSPAMRIVSCLVLLVSLLMLANAGRDEVCGTTSIRTGRGLPEVITNAKEPVHFRNAMNYHWVYAAMVLIGGIIAYRVESGLEKSEPLSPEFAGNKALDDWGDALKKEEERRKHPGL
jgi:hypothetical protein